MPDRYYDKINQTEAIEGVHSIDPPDVVALPDTNPFFAPLPEGQQLTYDIDGIPNGLEPIPAPVYTPEEQARLDLFDAGVTPDSISVAEYADHRGDPAPLAAIDAAVDQIALDNGLSTDDVIGQIQ